MASHLWTVGEDVEHGTGTDLWGLHYSFLSILRSDLEVLLASCPLTSLQSIERPFLSLAAAFFFFFLIIFNVEPYQRCFENLHMRCQRDHFCSHSS